MQEAQLRFRSPLHVVSETDVNTGLDDPYKLSVL